MAEKYLMLRILILTYIILFFEVRFRCPWLLLAALWKFNVLLVILLLLLAQKSCDSLLHVAASLISAGTPLGTRRRGNLKVWGWQLICASSSER